MPTGTVKWYNAQKGYGMIVPDGGGRDVFVHISAVQRSGMRALEEGESVSYHIEQGPQGRVSAVNLKLAGSVQRSTAGRAAVPPPTVHWPSAGRRGLETKK
jgi:cold shock protein